jgi:uncharacterized protein YbbC (DUF1343 family)
MRSTKRRISAAVVMGALVAGCADSTGQLEVRPGVDVLLADSVHLVRDRRVGVVTNQTGVDRRGVGDVDRLVGAGVDLRAIFSPEHGFRGNLEQPLIGHGIDSATGLPIYSLYGEQREPTREMLGSIDVVLVDLQDIGARPYTYISTTLHVMRAAAAMDVPVVVLDRPNPIGGAMVQGPLLDSTYRSFVGMLPVPLRHGMTLGELASFGNAVLGFGADLVVVPADGWRRDVWFDATGLPWLRPSPNMPDLESATHYPGLVLFEGTNLSVGRGTPIAFQVVAAPWLDAATLVTAVAEEPGVILSDTVVTPLEPGDRKYAGTQLPAVRLRVVDRTQYDPTRLAVRLLVALRAQHPDSFRLLSESYFDARAGSSALREALLVGRGADAVWQRWQGDVAAFRRRREPYLLYR